MRLYIDNRERSLSEVLTGIGVSYILNPLDIGDIDILGAHGQRFLFERKTPSDLAASLRDGRFKSQKDRLLGVLQREPSTAVAYILEGQLSENNSQRINGRVTVGTLRSLLNTIQLRYRIPVISTRNVKGTAILIQSVCKQLQTKPEFCPVGSGGNEGCAGHADVMPSIEKNTRRDNGSVWSTMLTAIRGISKKTASSIVSHFETIHPGGIAICMRDNTIDEFKDELQSIRINNRRLSKKIVQQMIELFYPRYGRSPSSSETTDEPTDEPVINERTPYNPGICDMYIRSSTSPSLEEIPISG